MNLTANAKKFWEKIPAEVRLKILNSVWCRTCREAIGIGNVEGKVEDGNLILKGFCITCGSPVARLVEGS